MNYLQPNLNRELFMKTFRNEIKTFFINSNRNELFRNKASFPFTLTRLTFCTSSLNFENQSCPNFDSAIEDFMLQLGTYRICMFTVSGDSNCPMDAWSRKNFRLANTLMVRFLWKLSFFAILVLSSILDYFEAISLSATFHIRSM